MAPHLHSCLQGQEEGLQPGHLLHQLPAFSSYKQPAALLGDIDSEEESLNTVQDDTGAEVLAVCSFLTIFFLSMFTPKLRNTTNQW